MAEDVLVRHSAPRSMKSVVEPTLRTWAARTSDALTVKLGLPGEGVSGFPTDESFGVVRSRVRMLPLVILMVASFMGYIPRVATRKS